MSSLREPESLWLTFQTKIGALREECFIPGHRYMFIYPHHIIDSMNVLLHELKYQLNDEIVDIEKWLDRYEE